MEKYPFSFLDHRAKILRNSRKQERRWAKKTRGRVQPASGALWGAKGDVREPATELLSNFLWENKQTSYKSFKLSIETWEDIKQKAYAQGNIPAMQIEFHSSTLLAPVRLVVLSEEDFLFLHARNNEKESK